MNSRRSQVPRLGTGSTVPACLTRRGFLAAAATTAALAPHAAPSPGRMSMNRPAVCVFSKHLQFLDYVALGETCASIGLDGVDLTVRRGGHVAPENVATDLPAAVEAVRGQGIDVPMITTNLRSGSDPDARPILEAAAKLGIRYFRVGGHKYDETGDPQQQLPGFIDALRSLAGLAEQYDMVAGYHNHSGFHQVGAPLWDLHRIVEAVGSDALGSNFDVGHAKVEGAYGAWQINARLLAPHVKMMAVKDFVWEDGRPRWIPLGKGLVDLTAFLGIFNKTGFAGPLSIHIEYKTASHEALIDDIRKAAVTVRTALDAAAYPA